MAAPSAVFNFFVTVNGARVGSDEELLRIGLALDATIQAVQDQVNRRSRQVYEAELAAPGLNLSERSSDFGRPSGTRSLPAHSVSIQPIHAGTRLVCLSIITSSNGTETRSRLFPDQLIKEVIPSPDASGILLQAAFTVPKTSASPPSTPAKPEPASTPTPAPPSVFVPPNANQHFVEVLTHSNDGRRLDIFELAKQKRRGTNRAAEERLDQRCVVYGLERHISPTDGNCQFASLSYGLHGGDMDRHKEVRKKIVTWLEANGNWRPDPLDPTSTLPNFLDTGKFATWEEYCEKMSFLGTWGDHVTLLAAANCFRVPIFILSDVEAKDSSCVTIIEPRLNPGDPAPDRMILLGHFHECHYVPLSFASASSPSRSPGQDDFQYDSDRDESPPTMIPKPAKYEQPVGETWRKDCLFFEALPNWDDDRTDVLIKTLTLEADKAVPEGPLDIFVSSFEFRRRIYLVQCGAWSWQGVWVRVAVHLLNEADALGPRPSGAHVRPYCLWPVTDNKADISRKVPVWRGLGPKMLQITESVYDLTRSFLRGERAVPQWEEIEASKSSKWSVNRTLRFLLKLRAEGTKDGKIMVRCYLTSLAFTMLPANSMLLPAAQKFGPHELRLLSVERETLKSLVAILPVLTGCSPTDHYYTDLAFDAQELLLQLDLHQRRLRPLIQNGLTNQQVADLNRHFVGNDFRLKPFQAEGVGWMISRERGTSFYEERPPVMPDGWITLDIKPKPIYVNLLSYVVQQQAPEHLNPRSCKGGILADEMGLGKTIQLLSLVLLNPRPGRPDSPAFTYPSSIPQSPNQKICPCQGFSQDEAMDGVDEAWIRCMSCRCLVHQACHPVETKPSRFYCLYCKVTACTDKPIRGTATLVVCPDMLFEQWCEEITERFGSSLNLVVYNGLDSVAPGEACKAMDPQLLASADVVLTTYEVLASDNNYRGGLEAVTRTGEQIESRRFGVPLLGVEWWRVCVDESQAIETGGGKLAKLAQSLKSVNRWGMSGTPLGVEKAKPDDLKRLYGLMSFLQWAPYSNAAWWKAAFQVPFSAGSARARQDLLTVLNTVMRRTSKARVIDEIKVPKPQQVRGVTVLRCSGITRLPGS